MRKYLLVMIACATVVLPTTVLAQSEALLAVYASRGDLQAAFDATHHRAIPGSTAGFMLDLEDWARRYGWQEYAELRSYGPKNDAVFPVRVSPKEVESRIGAQAYVVLDRATGEVLTVKRESMEWPIASLTKLMTTSVVLDHGVDMDAMGTVLKEDDVGGAKLTVNNGDKMTIQDLFYATLVASANNAANALARTSGLSKTDFVKAMNEKARQLNLTHTTFADPTGIELGNISTPLELARLARSAFDREEIRKVTSTATRMIHVANTGTEKKMINTNWMLWKPQYDDVWVTSGKTGYLNESGWNLAVSLKPSQLDQRELLIVIFGATSRGESFNDANRLANWAWDVYEWKKPSSI